MGLLDDLKKKLARGKPPAPAPAPSSEPDAAPIEVPEISPAELHARLAAGEPLVLLDVRTAWDHAAQHPAGARSLPLSELPFRLDELEPSHTYVLSCYHGYSSLDGCAFLIERGFPNVASLRGGFSGWAAAGLPIEGEH